MPKSLPLISVSPDRQRFERNELVKVQAYLHEQKRKTLSTEVTSLSELQLNKQGEVNPHSRGVSYRYTTPALLKVCQMAASSLFQVVDDVAGQTRKPNELSSAYSRPAAIEIFNAVMKLRFEPRFQSKAKLLWNRLTHQIEGAAGVRYSHLENNQLLELAESAASAATTRLVFHEAAIDGRRLLLRFVQAKPLFTIRTPDGPEPYYGGIHFVNSELAGECSVRAAVLMVRGGRNTSALGSYVSEGGSGGRVVHTGHDFNVRVQELMQTVVATFETLGVHHKDLQRLTRQPLGLVSVEAKDKRNKALQTILTRAGLKPGIAKRVLQAVQYFGSSPVGRKKPIGYVSKSQLAGRTAYDLYNALAGVAVLLPVAARESAEQAAYSIMTGKVRVEPPEIMQ
jgi:hypothetical protein